MKQFGHITKQQAVSANQANQLHTHGFRSTEQYPVITTVMSFEDFEK